MTLYPTAGAVSGQKWQTVTRRDPVSPHSPRNPRVVETAPHLPLKAFWSKTLMEHQTETSSWHDREQKEMRLFFFIWLLQFNNGKYFVLLTSKLNSLFSCFAFPCITQLPLGMKILSLFLISCNCHKTYGLKYVTKSSQIHWNAFLLSLPSLAQSKTSCNSRTIHTL